MADLDGDSQMNSSSSDEHDSDAMFPTEQQQQRQHLPTSTLFQSSELSPPHSQDALGSESLTFGNDDIMDTSHGETQASSASKEPMSVVNILSDEKAEKSEPGWAWKNKKAREEHARVMDQVVDKSFSLKQYGDPFDEDERPQPAQSTAQSNS